MKSNKYIIRHLKEKNANNNGALCIIIFKPGYLNSEIKNFKKFCKINELKIIKEKNITFSREMVIALYPKIFSFSKDDLRFGVLWKEQTIKYLTSDFSKCFIIEGNSVTTKLSKYKYLLRKKYGKITHPTFIMSSKEFYKKVVKNIVHVVDNSELQNQLWLLFS
jgi:hypothetical protein